MTSFGRRHPCDAWPRLKAVPAPVSSQAPGVGRADDGSLLGIEYSADFGAVASNVPGLDQTERPTEPL